MSSRDIIFLGLLPKKHSFSFVQHEERAFVLKFSAIEIYNEVVRDLLSAENTPLRLWDDSEVKQKDSWLALCKSLFC
jgi:hypothetical protein